VGLSGVCGGHTGPATKVELERESPPSLPAGSDYVLTRYVVNEGSGAVVRAGLRIPLAISLWKTKPPDLVDKILDTRTALVARRAIAVVAGNATLGKALDMALLTTYGPPVRRGGELRIVIREEAADEILAGLGVKRSSIPAHAQLLVQVMLPGARPAPTGAHER
jgi:hypothetical protein